MVSNLSISLIISTYNQPRFLELVLQSVLGQKSLPDEVVIADDGSSDETKKLIDSYREKFPIPLVHVWHEDDGYKLSAIKNKSVAKSSCDYIIFIDGDLMLHPCFILDYRDRIQPDSILVASRAFLSEQFTQQLIAANSFGGKIDRGGIEKNIISSYRIPWLNNFVKGKKTYHGARGGLMGVFKNDYIKVNGFDESFTGWGREDSELYVRLLNSGVKRMNIKFAAITYHLWHKTLSRDSLSSNDQRLAESIAEKKTWCANGIEKYLLKT